VKFLDHIKLLTTQVVRKAVILGDKLYIENDNATAILVVIDKEECQNGRKYDVLKIGQLKDMSDYEQVQVGLMTESQRDLNMQNTQRRLSAEAKERRRQEWIRLNAEFAPETADGRTN
jgi:hypothetical protein